MKTIAIVAGGDSSEYEVSLRSAKGLSGFIDNERYRLYTVLMRFGKWTVVLPDESPEIDKNDFSFQSNGQKIKFDYAYITIHGRPGEDGRLQGYFDMLGIPYSSCGVLASALTFNKYINNRYLKAHGVRIANSILLPHSPFEGGQGDVISSSPFEGGQGDVKLGVQGDVISSSPFEGGQGDVIKLPVFVKPTTSGSSFGISKVKDPSQLRPAIEKAFSEGNEVIIESFIEGTEVTCGCYKTKTKQVVFPVSEVIPDNEFFDYNAKYNGQVQEITPARLPGELAKAIQQETLRIYDLIGAKGLIRIDYIIPADNHPVLLEVNTTPGMTETSFIPQQIKAAGLDIKDVMTDIIENL